MTHPVSYKRHRFPPEIIAGAVWLYLRLPLSLRLVEEMLLERGILVSYETERRRAQKFGPDYARHRQVKGLTAQSPTGSAGQKPATRPVTLAQVVKAWAREVR
jgi:transposase-like protein